MKVGDLVAWRDYKDILRYGLILSDLRRDKYCEVLVGGKVEFCHERNLEVINESR